MKNKKHNMMKQCNNIKHGSGQKRKVKLDTTKKKMDVTMMRTKIVMNARAEKVYQHVNSNDSYL